MRVFVGHTQPVMECYMLEEEEEGDCLFLPPMSLGLKSSVTFSVGRKQNWQTTQPSDGMSAVQEAIVHVFVGYTQSTDCDETFT